MEVDTPSDMETTSSEPIELSQLAAKVEDQRQLIQNLYKQIDSQNLKIQKQELVMRKVMQQVHALTLTTKPVEAEPVDNPPVIFTVPQPPQNNVAHSSVPQTSVKKPEELIPIFKGMHFFITADGGGIDYARGLPPGLPYPKDEYLQAIQRYGSQVVDSVGRERGSPVFLISDQHARTVKYVYCLAAGIPCISYEWIRKCINMRELVDYKPFILKAGYSMEQEAIIDRHLLKPLKDMKIFIATDSDELYTYWRPVLLAAEANLMPHNKTITEPPLDTEVLITDGACTKQMLDAAKENSIPIVRPEWLVQSIIMGVRADASRQDLYSAIDE